MSKKRRCTGTTKNNTPCTATARKGQDRCWRHPRDTSDATSRARNEAWSRETWLELFEQTLMVTEACRGVGIHRSTAYAERDRNEDFATAWDEVEQRVTERLEAEAYRRAVEGVEAPVVSAGKVVTTETRFSDGLLQFLLKGRKPGVYRERVDVQHGGGVKVTQRTDLSGLDDDELETLGRITEKLAA